MIYSSIKVCRNGSYHRQSSDGSSKDPLAASDDPTDPLPIENCCKPMHNVNDIRPTTTAAAATTVTKSGSNGRANSVHLIGPPATASAEMAARELRQRIKERVEKFTTERAMHSLWIFPPNDK